MRFTFLGLFLFCSFLLFADGGSRTNPSDFSIEITPGPHYLNSGKIMFVKFTKGPQMAAWMESMGGEYLGTVFATGKSVDKDWASSTEKGRPESLPVWFSRIRGNEQIDAVSSASVNEGAQSYSTRYPDREDGFYVYMEVNMSYDWNEYWEKDLKKSHPRYNGVNGQPSLIYRAFIPSEQDAADEIFMEPYGNGDVAGKNGAISLDFTGMDTAFTILESAVIRFD